jgi:hypothetical protein
MQGKNYRFYGHRDPTGSYFLAKEMAVNKFFGGRITRHELA